MVKNDKVLRVALYIRVSTDEQAKHGYSLDSQKQRLEDYSKEKGYRIFNTYADEGKSARSKLSARKELLKLLDDVKEHKVDRIIFWRLDRWFRNIQDYYKVQEILDKNNVDWECTDEEYNTTTSNGRLYLNIKLSIAQNESDQTGDRIRFNFESMVKNKKAIFGNRGTPPGYIVVGKKGDKKIVKDENEIDLVNDMFSKFEETKSVRKTLFFINQKYNKKYLYANFRSYLKNPLYIGKYRDVYDYCEPYLTIDRWNDIQETLNKNVKVYNKKNVYIFSGLIRCPHCNNKLSGSYYFRNVKEVRTIYKHYHCGYRTTSGLCDWRTYLKEDKVEKWLVDNFISKLDEKVKTMTIESKEEEIIIDEKKLKEKLKRLDELYLDLRITKEKYDNEYNQINEQLNYNSKKVDMSKYKDLIKLDSLFMYNKLDDDHKLAFWKEYIDYIIPTDDGFNIFWKF